MSLEDAMLKVAKKQVARKALELRNAIVEELSTEGRGKLYKVAGVARYHRASRAGDPPAVNFGTLRGSIGIEKINDLRVRVGTNVEYAPYLEFGTYKMSARPFMRVALQKVRYNNVRNR